MKRFSGIKLFSKLDLILLAAVCILLLDSNLRLTVTEYHISSQGLPKAFEGYTIVQLSDLHTMEFGRDNRRLVAKVAELQPDLIALTGDFIESAEDLPIVEVLAAQLSDIAPVYFTSGNHDCASGAIRQLEETVNQSGGTYLSNEATLIEHRGAYILLVGAEDPNRSAEQPKPDALLEELHSRHPDLYTILLAHRNDFPILYPELPCDLIFTGHGHGGVVRLPFVGGLVGTDLKLFPKYDAGVFPSGQYHMVVSRGLGGAPFYPRVLNHPEIVAVTLHAK